MLGQEIPFLSHTLLFLYVKHTFRGNELILVSFFIFLDLEFNFFTFIFQEVFFYLPRSILLSSNFFLVFSFGVVVFLFQEVIFFIFFFWDYKFIFSFSLPRKDLQLLFSFHFSLSFHWLILRLEFCVTLFLEN